jgi:nicotinamide-nucleotide amidase
MTKALINRLRELGWHIATVESCTGGSLAAAITDVPGASDVYGTGYVTYSKGAKRQLANLGRHRPLQDAITDHGVYSSQTALGMAEAGRRASGAEVCVAVTGMLNTGHPDDPAYVGCVADVAVVIQGKSGHRALLPPVQTRFYLNDAGRTRPELKVILVDLIVGLVLSALEDVKEGS